MDRRTLASRSQEVDRRHDEGVSKPAGRFSRYNTAPEVDQELYRAIWKALSSITESLVGEGRVYGGPHKLEPKVGCTPIVRQKVQTQRSRGEKSSCLRLIGKSASRVSRITQDPPAGVDIASPMRLIGSERRESLRMFFPGASPSSTLTHIELRTPKSSIPRRIPEARCIPAR